MALLTFSDMINFSAIMPSITGGDTHICACLLFCYNLIESKFHAEEEGCMKEYDVIVVGSGAGAMIVENALSQGLSVALVDKGPLGGTCLNVG